MDSSCPEHIFEPILIPPSVELICHECLKPSTNQLIFLVCKTCNENFCFECRRRYVFGSFEKAIIKEKERTESKEWWRESWEELSEDK